MEVIVTTTAIRRAKPSQILTTNKPTPSFYGQILFPLPNQQRQRTAGKSITFHGLAHGNLTLGSSNLVFVYGYLEAGYKASR